VTSPKIGVVTGMGFEAEVLRPLEAKGLVRLGVAGASEKKAAQLAREMARQGVKALLSFGICGGLVPEVKVGDLVLAESVHHHRGQHWPTDESWRQAVQQALAADPRARMRVHLGRLTGSPVIVDQPAETLLRELPQALRELTLPQRVIDYLHGERPGPLL
jgi:nucleoside phosphorylase